MDSVYISDIMAHIGKFEWGINMVYALQVNQTGADAKAVVLDMTNRKGIHESNLWQHNNLLLVFKAWSVYDVVKSLRNFCSPIFIQVGIQQQIKINKVRQHDPVDVPVPPQQKDYLKIS